ncbi:hypothetical protein N7532_001388 [Penicillium argentinense]|uniref:Uncharacterized protein n=1 Tax=Penicillium argentinense TaxID=1131581 RepID=A0A9W9G2N1_9EURO|nr:uncharacterized protein N7532_001388 [Penicillium argentinense]KAJ5110853.1 hypothetical protein N7532_001388 [Penicillium argentinense]
MLPEDIQKELDKITARATSRGYTREYQDRREREENTISYKELAPATLQNYEKSAKNWILWRLSRGEATDTNFRKDQPIPTPQVLKSFVEYYVVTREKIPTQSSTCQNFIKFTSQWERKTSCSISKEVKDDVLNYIRTELTSKWKLPTKPRERFMVTAKDMDYLIRGLFNDDWHDYKHERARIQTASALALFFHGVADGAFKGLTTVAEVLSMRPPKGRESLTLEWNEDKKELPFLRMINHDGPQGSRALTFSALRHSFSSLAQRMCFRDKLRVHGIRGGVANRIDPKASEAARGQALDHQNHSTFLKYQSVLKSVDIQSAFYDIEPDYECRDMEQSLAHHRDINMPQRLDAAAITEFTESEEVQSLIQRIRHLTSEISGKPHLHEHLAKERSQLYTRKAKLLAARKSEFIQEWWNSSYEEYVSGNEFTERDRTSLFEIYKKYLPERTRVREALFTETTMDSEIGRACLEDMVTLLFRNREERSIYYNATDDPLAEQITNNATQIISEPIGVFPANLLNFVISAQKYFARKKNGLPTVETISIIFTLDAEV